MPTGLRTQCVAVHVGSRYLSQKNLKTILGPEVDLLLWVHVCKLYKNSLSTGKITAHFRTACSKFIEKLITVCSDHSALYNTTTVHRGPKLARRLLSMLQSTLAELNLFGAQGTSSTLRFRPPFLCFFCRRDWRRRFNEHEYVKRQDRSRCYFVENT